MQTKPFINSFGTEVQLTRQQYIERWTDQTNNFVYMFGKRGSPAKLQAFIDDVVDMAGQEWDSQ